MRKITKRTVMSAAKAYINRGVYSFELSFRRNKLAGVADLVPIYTAAEALKDYGIYVNIQLNETSNTVTMVCAQIETGLE